MSKKKIFIIAILCCIGLMGVVFILSRGEDIKQVVAVDEEKTVEPKQYPDKVPARSWNEVEDDYIVCTTKLLGEVMRTYTDTGSISGFDSKLSLDDMAQTNPKGFVGNIMYTDILVQHEGRLFYHNNNYYVLFETGKNSFIARNCFSVYVYDSHWLNVPMPATIYFDKVIHEMCMESSYNMFSEFMKQYPFEKLSQYYDRMNEDVYVIDEEKQTITVDAYSEDTKKIMDQFLVIDYANQCMRGTNEDGEEEVWK